MAAQYKLYFCMLAMLVTGTLNMLLLKFQFKQELPMQPNGPPVHFDHPWLQAAFMMLGEFLCLLVYFFKRTQDDSESDQKVPKWVFLVPCCCDMTATALMCMGLALIAVSVAQMCRGTIVVFVCIMTALFLGRRQQKYQVFGVSLVTCGIVVVALSAVLSPKAQAHPVMPAKMMTGVLICVFAQFFQATMYVYEEKIMSKYVIEPLLVVGMEGLYGLCISVPLLTGLYLTGIADTLGAFYQIQSSPKLFHSIVAGVLSTAIFNLAGVTVTQKSSAVARTTIKISATISIWLAELAFGWNTFSSLQLMGFILVASGTLIYNRLVNISCLEVQDEKAPILANSKMDLKADSNA